MSSAPGDDALLVDGNSTSPSARCSHPLLWSVFELCTLKLHVRDSGLCKCPVLPLRTVTVRLGGSGLRKLAGTAI